MFMDQRHQHNKDVNFPQIELQTQCNYYQILARFFGRHRQVSLKFVWKCKHLRKTRTRILTKNIAGGITQPILKLTVKLQ